MAGARRRGGRKKRLRMEAAKEEDERVQKVAKAIVKKLPKSAPKRPPRKRKTAHGAKGSELNPKTGVPESIEGILELTPDDATLEKQAVREEWMLGSNEEAQKLRKALLLKVLRTGLTSPDEATQIAALRTVSNAEIKQMQLELLRERSLPQAGDVGLVLDEPKDDAPAAPKPYQVVQGLLARDDIVNALRGTESEPASDQPGP